jgi:hypothetical protein
MTLPNGTVLTEADLALIEAVRPEGEAFMASLDSSASPRTLQDSAVDPGKTVEELRAEIHAFMREKFGDGYEKYMMEGTESREITIQETSPSARTAVSYYEDGVFLNRVKMTANWFVLPYGSRNIVDATTWEIRKDTPDFEYASPVVRLTVQMKDDVTNKATYFANCAYIAVFGNYKTGLFPPYPKHLVQTTTIDDPKAGPTGAKQYVINWW